MKGSGWKGLVLFVLVTGGLCLSTGSPVGAQVTDTNGYITSNNWLVLGPFANDFGCSGSSEDILCDHIAPSILHCQYPVDGDEVDYDSALACTNSYSGPTGLSGYPQWVPFSDGSDNCDNDLDGDAEDTLDNVVSFLATYVAYDGVEPVEIQLCGNSDDGLQVWWDGTIVINNNACRGRGGCAGGACNDTGSVTVTPGVHRILVGTWESGGGWGNSLRLQQDGLPIVDGVDLDWTFLGIDSDGHSAPCDVLPVRTTALSGSADDCPSSVGGPLIVTVTQEGGDAGETVTVTETVVGALIAGQITPDNGGTATDILGAVEVVWNVPRSILQGAGVSYQIDIGNGETVDLTGNVDGVGTMAPTVVTIPPEPVDLGPFANPDLDHAHDIGQACAGTDVFQGADGEITITGAGADIWGTGDEFVYAYSPVSGDFTAVVHIADRVLGNNTWAKHGIMARENCGPGSRYAYTCDQNDAGLTMATGSCFQWRDTTGGDAAWTGSSPLGGGHADTLRLDRIGSLFIGYAYDEDGSLAGTADTWVELARSDWGDAPEEIQLGLAVTSHDGCNLISVTFDEWEVFTGSPQDPPYRTVTTGADPTACPTMGGSPVTAVVSQDLGFTDPGETVDVEEIARGPFTAADVTATDGGVVTDYVPTGRDHFGFINAWLLLGPYARTVTSADANVDNPSAAPGTEAIQADYLTDGADVIEIEVEPEAGDTVDTDYTVADSDALVGNDPDINPGGVPTWALWIDNDDTIDFNEYYGGDVNDIMMYAVTYIDVEADVDVDLCVGSDDSIQVQIDHVEVHLNNIPRGYGAAGTCTDTVPIGVLTAGRHQVMVKVIEGGGGHGFRLAFKEAGTSTAAPGISVCTTPSGACGFDIAGVQVNWTDITRETLDDGVSYEIDLDDGSIGFTGTAASTATTGDATATVSPAPMDYGPIGPFTVVNQLTDEEETITLDHAHTIGVDCVGTEVTQDGDLVTITGAGADIWGAADQFMYAYTEVTGDFSLTVRVNERLMGANNWAKHGIMARANCSPGSPYVYCADQQAIADFANETAFQWRDTQDGGAAWSGVSTIPDLNDETGHADVLRLDRIGTEFIAYGLDEDGLWGGIPGEWYELGRRSDLDGLQMPETIQLGLAVTSHDACNLVTVTFEVGEFQEPGDGFLRGDADASGVINITDGIYVLNFLFLGGPEPSCLDAADVDDSGTVNITDGIYALNFLFLGGPPPPAPHPLCGADPTADPGGVGGDLGCLNYPPEECPAP